MDSAPLLKTENIIQRPIYFPCNPLLAPFIYSYGFIEYSAGISEQLITPPNCMCGFIFNHGPGKIVAKIYENTPFCHQSNCIAGQQTLPIRGYIEGPLTQLLVFFKPLGIYKLFGCDMSRFVNRSVSLVDFLGAEKAHALIDSLQWKMGLENQTDILNKFFIDRLCFIKNNADFETTEIALEIIHASNGYVNIEDIEKQLYVTGRTLERNFIKQVGISQKKYAQIYRFKTTLDYLDQHPGSTWADITYHNNYFDQSHMIRYFNKYLKCLPTNFEKLDKAFLFYFCLINFF